ncbi:MAG: hypothetical protein FK733_07315 [Asgard group archaeon]|nr:hypothetical protein [Asgard group archaeon]
MGNNNGNSFFKIAITITLTGFLLYFIQEIITWAKYPGSIGDFGVPITIIISAALMLITIILLIIVLFMGFDNAKMIRVAIMIGALYLLAFTMVNFFFPFFDNSSWSLGGDILGFYQFDALSFICLLLLGIVSIFLFVFSITKMSEDRIITSELITYILTLGLILVFDASSISSQRISLLGFAFFGYYGFFMLPFFYEIVLLALLIIILGIRVANRENNTLDILGIILLNIFFVSIISITASGTIWDVTYSNDTIPYCLGNYLLVLGTVLTFIASIIKINGKLGPTANKY